MLPTDIGPVMERLDPFLDDFSAIAHHAVSIYRSYPPAVLVEHSKRAAANNVYDHMVEEASRRFDGRSDVRLVEIRGLKLWLLGADHHTVIRWKKMDEDGKSRNYPTKQAKSFDFQQELAGLPPKPVRVTVGYLLDVTGTKIDRVQVARPNALQVDWCAAIIPSEHRADESVKWVDVTKQSRLA